MHVETKSDTKNELLKRREINLSVSYEGKTPSREVIISEASKSLGISVDNIVIVRIAQAYGSRSAEVLLHAYMDAESMKTAPKHLVERVGRKKAKKAREAGKPAEAAAPAAEAAKKEEASGGAGNKQV